MESEPPQSDGSPGGFAARLTGFFKSLTGVITSFLALLGAAGTLYVTLTGGSEASNDDRGSVTLVTIPTRTEEEPARVATPVAPEATLAMWRRDANRICADFAREIRATLGRPPATPEEVVYFLQVVLPLSNRVRVDIAGLDAPANRLDEITELLDAFEERDDYGVEAIGAWQAGNAAVFQRAITEVDRLDKKGSRVAAALGARECAVGPFD